MKTENVNIQLVLDTKDFDKKLKELQKTIDDLNNTKIVVNIVTKESRKKFNP